MNVQQAKARWWPTSPPAHPPTIGKTKELMKRPVEGATTSKDDPQASSFPHAPFQTKRNMQESSNQPSSQPSGQPSPCMRTLTVTTVGGGNVDPPQNTTLVGCGTTVSLFFYRTICLADEGPYKGIDYGHFDADYTAGSTFNDGGYPITYTPGAPGSFSTPTGVDAHNHACKFC